MAAREQGVDWQALAETYRTRGEAAEAEVERLREANREIHRRAQAGESAGRKSVLRELFHDGTARLPALRIAELLGVPYTGQSFAELAEQTVAEVERLRKYADGVRGANHAQSARFGEAAARWGVDEARYQAEIARLGRVLGNAAEECERLTAIVAAADALREAYSDTRGGVLVDLMRVAGACRAYDAVRGER